MDIAVFLLDRAAELEHSARDWPTGEPDTAPDGPALSIRVTGASTSKDTL